MPGPIAASQILFAHAAVTRPGERLLHAERASERYGVPAHAILQKVGEYGYVGGQEDMIIDIAIELRDAAEREALGADGASGLVLAR